MFVLLLGRGDTGVSAWLDRHLTSARQDNERSCVIQSSHNTSSFHVADGFSEGSV